MRVRAEHWQVLLDMCEKNPQLITNRFNGIEGKTKGQILWQTAACKFNSLGYGEKYVDHWRKTLTDWKSKTKTKANKIKQEMQQTGGGPKSYVPLSELEERLLTLMGTKAIDGNKVPELGYGKVTITEITEQITEVQPPNNMNDHIYCGDSNDQHDTDENRPGKENKRSISTNINNSQSETSRKRLRPGERTSKELINMNKESLRLLENISGRTESIANSLNIISNVLQSRSSNTNNSL